MDEAARAATDVVMNEYESVLLERTVKSRYGYLTKDEQAMIIKNAKSLAAKNDTSDFPPFSARRKDVYDNIRAYLGEEGTIVPCGFVDFRMRKMYYWAEKIAEKGADMFFDQKEYEEFTYLLSMFVAEKEPREEVIHLLWENDKIKLLNKRGRNVTKKYEKEFMEAAKEKNIFEDDLAISAIISAAPKKLRLHMPPDNSPLAETLMKIFTSRASICQGCNICKKD
ncbi:MAG: putative sporulation protein YtxC [Clostridia bacterium]|nr:putative sporulation protein YtxC [Clostridia bacterium]